MTREEAEIYAKTMTYEDALYNLLRARAIPYRKATFIKVNELIKALSQEPCTDAVSREAVIEILENYGCTNREGLIFKDIRALPSVTHKSGKWIPVSKRLPEDGTYLVTVERMCGTPSVNIRSFAKNLYSVDEYDFHNKKGKSGWYDYDSEYGYWEDEKVTAWLPLPKPYEPQESEARNESKG